IHPARGRGFSAAEDRKGAPHVVVLTDGLWRRAFSADPRIVGQTLTFDGRPTLVAGVMPPGVHLPLIGEAQALVPFEFDPKNLNRGMHGMYAIGRLKPGVTEAQVKVELDLLGPRLASRLANHAGM